MFVKRIFINNFRNIDETELFLDNKINYIIGNNAQGKTNLVESIYISAFLKSFRTKNILDIIKEGEKEFKIELDVELNDVINKVFLVFSKKNKKVEVNDKITNKYNYLNVVVFYPEEINYLSSYPIYRRNLIDRSIFFTNINYINIYRKYLRCLKQRNLFLKNNDGDSDCWIDQLLYYGSKIIRSRIEYINKINTIFSSKEFKNICKESYSISYSNKYINNEIENRLYDDFIRKKERELYLGYSLVGPHRDDISFYLNDKPAEIFASQGQKRSMIISFKTAQIIDYKNVQGHYPVLILDDMSSELDNNRNNNLIENLLDNSGQVLITSTELKKNNIFGKSKVFKVDNGKISNAD